MMVTHKIDDHIKLRYYKDEGCGDNDKNVDIDVDIPGNYTCEDVAYGTIINKKEITDLINFLQQALEDISK